MGEVINENLRLLSAPISHFLHVILSARHFVVQVTRSSTPHLLEEASLVGETASCVGWALAELLTGALVLGRGYQNSYVPGRSSQVLGWEEEVGLFVE